MALSMLGSATRSVLDFVPTELRTMLAIATWEKGASNDCKAIGGSGGGKVDSGLGV